MADKIKRLPKTDKSGEKVVREAIPKRKEYKSYSTDSGMMVPGFNTSGQFVGYSLKRPVVRPTKNMPKGEKYAGGGRAMRGYGKAYMKGGKVK